MATVQKRAASDAEPSLLEICEEVSGLLAGSIAALLPFVVLSAPALLPLVVLGGIVLSAVALVMAVLGALLGVPILLVRMVARRRTR